MLKTGAVRTFAGLRLGVISLLAGAGLAASLPIGQAMAAPTTLTLINGWTGGGFGTRSAAATTIGGVVHLQGAIATAGTNAEPFVLPKAFRPSTAVYVPVDMCNATKGRLYIQPTGDVSVQAETQFSNAQCFTSLEGASFAKTGNGYTALSMINGWVGQSFSTAAPSVNLINNVVQFRGAMSTSGTSTAPFILPVGFRPDTVRYVPVDMCNATKGRLIIQTDGTVAIQAKTDFSSAQCFTSLEGASFELGSMKTLSLLNGWTGSPYSTSLPAIKLIGDVVHFRGAMVTTGTSSQPFKLPPNFRPSVTVYAPVDMCNAQNGRLVIEPSGVVTVQAETDFANAQCFTSLERLSFIK